MKCNVTILVIFCFFICLNISSQSCNVGTLNFSTQEQVDQFPINYPGCSDVIGNINIYLSYSNIQNLNALSSITNINGSLYIEAEYPNGTPNYSGLNNIQQVTQTITLNYIYSATFNNLSKVGGSFIINSGEPAAYPNLTKINNILKLENTESYNGFNSFQNLDSVGTIHFNGTYIYQGFNAFADLDTVGLLKFSYNIGLSSLNGLDHPFNVDSIVLVNNSQLTSCNIEAVCSKLYVNKAFISNNGPQCLNNTQVLTLCPALPDNDFDGIPDLLDNCPLIFNPNQADFDNDNIGNACDMDYDYDNDGILNGTDNCPFINNPLQEDTNNNSIGNVCELNVLCQGNKSFLNQNDLDAFGTTYQDCNVYEGLIKISSPNELILNTNGLSQIDTLNGNLILYGGSNTSMSGFKNLKLIVGSIFFNINSNLFDTGFSNLKKVVGNLDLRSNTDTKFFTNLDTLTGNLLLSNYSNVLNSMFLSSLDYVGNNITLFGIKDLRYIQNLDTIFGSLKFLSYNNTTNLALLNLKHIEGDLIFTYYPSGPDDINSFNGLNSISGNLYIRDVSLLKTISGFQNLSIVNGKIVLNNNINLENLSGFDHTITTDSIIVTNNIILQNCAVQAICEKSIIGGLKVNDNNFGCNSINIIKERCPTPPDVDSDEIYDFIDNCPSIFNPDQRDCNNNDLGDVCEGYVDNDCDGIANATDNCPDTYNPYQIDYNNNNLGDACESFPKVGFNTTLPKTEMHLSYSNVYLDHPEKGLIVKDHNGICYKTVVEMVNGQAALKLVQITCP